MVKFSKMHGLGNDYICINCIENILSDNHMPQIVRYLCNRNFGVGADGVILIKKSNVADIRMQIFNKDGTEAEMCGNGIRCFAKYVYEKKILESKFIKIETKCGIKTAKIISDTNGNVQEIEIDMGMPIFDDKKNICVKNDYRLPIVVKFKINNKQFVGNYVSMGNPHLVIFVNDVEKFDICTYGKIIENMKCFPNKINVEFVQSLGRNTLKIRVWERGVGETFACGTGACASFAIGYYRGVCSSYVKTILKGGELKIRYNKQNRHIYMAGIATYVFDGKIEAL